MGFFGHAVYLARHLDAAKPRHFDIQQQDIRGQLFDQADGLHAIFGLAHDFYILGDIGPSGKLIKPLGPLSYHEVEEAFFEQACGLIQGKVDAILVETMSDLNEARAAVEGARRAMQDLPEPLPILATMSFDTRGRTMMGVKPAQAAQALCDLKVDAIGANCGRTLSETLDAVQAMHAAAPQAVLVAKPNAGLPRRELEQGKDATAVYDVTPEEMAEWAKKFAALGVRIFGGCCGSTPDHIRAMAEVLRE